MGNVIQFRQGHATILWSPAKKTPAGWRIRSTSSVVPFARNVNVCRNVGSSSLLTEGGEKHAIKPEKYEFTGRTKVLGKATLKQIRRLSDGAIGGWIESEVNLSHKGDCWVGDDACVYGDASVFGNAHVLGNAHVSGDAQVYGYAHVYGYARVYGAAWVAGNAHVSGDAQVFEDAHVYGNAQVYGDARVYVNAHVFGNAQVSGDARVCGNARVSGNVSGSTVMSGSAYVHE